MNAVLIIFLIFVIILAIYLVAQFYNPSYLISKSTKLNILNSTQLTIPITSIENPGSTRYFYEGWFFIHSNAPIATANVLYNRGNDFIVTLTGSTLNVYVNASANSVSPKGILDTSSKTPIITIPNFPFQKWCHLVINVDGTSVDLYIDGKFVQNVKNPNIISASITDPITYGNHYTVGYVARFRRPAASINPQGVWSSYMNGSGQDSSFTSYHLNAQLTKNKHITADQRLI